MADPSLPSYALITPARNEAAFIEQAIRAVVSQTWRPVRWVVVSDGSTDATDSIVAGHARDHDWIRLVSMAPGGTRNFGAKVLAFNAGRRELSGVAYDVIGNLDADITFEPDYFEFLMSRFAEDPRLGVAGTPFVENGRRPYDYRFTSIEHVSGACQLFRRQCFEDIGGYTQVSPGGVDLIAVLRARMRGWHTRTFVEKTCRHHRCLGTATCSPLVLSFKGGGGDYVLGSHPLWEVARCVYQATRRPVVLGGLLRLAGFTWAMLMRTGKQVPPDLVRFRRAEQMRRLRAFFSAGPRQAARDAGRGSPMIQRAKNILVKRLQQVAWVYFTNNFYIERMEDLVRPKPRMPLELVRITPDNSSRVCDFRTADRCGEYAKKLREGEIGYFAAMEGEMVGSVWATVNSTTGPTVARGYMPLQPGEALLHDCVTCEKYRGSGVAPFMFTGITAALLAEGGVSRIVVDIKPTNRPSIRIMEKAGLKAREATLALSVLGSLVWRRTMPPRS